jgi:hypothetical protein
MKTPKTLLCAGIMACCVAGNAAAQQYALDIGVTPFFDKLSASATIKNIDVALNDQLGLDKNNTLWEGFAAINTRTCSLRGYYLFPKSVSADSLLPVTIAVDKDKKPIPVTTTFTLKANRLEVAVPLRVNRFVMVEPMFVYQTISPVVSITGKGYSFTSNPKLSAAGIGVELTEKVARNTLVRLKYVATANMSLFEAEARYVDGAMFFGGGYSCWNYDTAGMKVRVQGPMARAGFRF